MLTETVSPNKLGTLHDVRQPPPLSLINWTWQALARHSFWITVVVFEVWPPAPITKSDQHSRIGNY
ncbi:MAG: hypothetical protein JSR78_11265 [Proteobacteria bacterium]|nr:hypothetical protein [Pseudomonadota bacterium]